MGWSYNTGRRGISWVRGYEKEDGLYIEWFEDMLDAKGRPVLNARGKPKRRRPRQKLRCTDYRDAENDARAFSDYLESQHGGRATTHRLIDDYIAEVTPTKGESKQDHDRRAAGLFKVVIPITRLACALDRSDWDSFIAARREGRIEGFRPAGDRVIQYDLKFMISVLGWGVGTKWLQLHPWGPEVRRTQGWRMPKNRTPRRPAMTDDLREALSAHASSWQFPLALHLGRATVSRNVSVAQLAWRDIDFTAGEVEWTREKDGGRYRTPLHPRAIELLRSAPSRGIGGAWVFPAGEDPTRHTPRDTFQTWLRRAKAGLLRSIDDAAERERMRERLRGLGYHGEKRAAIRDPKFRKLPATVRSALARTSAKTMDEVYDEVSLEDMREGLQQVQI